MGAPLNNLVITDLLPSGLTRKSASWQAWNGSAWGAAISVPPNENGEYAIGNINSKILLTIVTDVPDENYTTGIKTYTNSASINWDGMPGTGIGSGSIGVGVGYNALHNYRSPDYTGPPTGGRPVGDYGAVHHCTELFHL